MGQTENQDYEVTEINFKGKEFVHNHHLSVPFRPLVPHADKSIGDPALDGNLIIHGDNLHALKALLPLYAGKVDCVFIDPPYNTGNEGWSYNDNVNAPMIREWLSANPIGEDDGLRHDKWCAMMWPRLRLLHELLSDRGTIWITLDANEVHRAKMMLSEIFGDERHALGILVWEKADSPRMDAETFSSSHDLMLVFAKNPDEMILERVDRDSAPADHYNLRDEHGRLYYLKPLRAMGSGEDTREDRPKMYFALTDPDGNQVYPMHPDGVEGRWRWGSDKAKREGERIDWVQGERGWVPYYRIYADTTSGRPPETIWYNKDVGGSRRAKAEIKQIFGSSVFDTPKPVALIDRVLEIATESDSIVLDSFAGSGTTGHAVLQANKRDGGQRRFILVEMEDYADRLTAERMRRVSEGYSFNGTLKTELLRQKITWSVLKGSGKLLDEIRKTENLQAHEFDKVSKTVKDGELIVTGENALTERTEGLGGSFTYCTLGDPVELDKILSGEILPSYDALGAVLFNMATNRAFDPARLRKADSYLGQANDQHLWLIYKPDLDWLKSPEAALTFSRAKEIAATDKQRRHLVFAPARYVSQKILAEQDIPVEFAPLPFALYRIDRS